MLGEDIQTSSANVASNLVDNWLAQKTHSY